LIFFISTLGALAGFLGNHAGVVRNVLVALVD
jgi:hypothetical protein